MISKTFDMPVLVIFSTPIFAHQRLALPAAFLEHLATFAIRSKDSWQRQVL
jgi:hypothetical protein